MTLGLLTRTRSLRIRPVIPFSVVHHQKDPGCFHSPQGLLAPFTREAERALVILDRAWDGVPSEDPEGLAMEVEERLRGVWEDRARCVVIDPEVEVWLWSDSPQASAALGWEKGPLRLRKRLESEGLWPRECSKPPDPKRAFDRVLGYSNMAYSSAIFRRVAERVGLERCQDPSFAKLVDILRGWFGEPRVEHL